MTEPIGIAALGLILGMRHAADPDHVVAITTLVVRHRDARGAALIGLAWGFGHTVTVFVVGSALILMGWVIPVRLSVGAELLVCAMLVVLGVANLVGKPKPAPAEPSPDRETVEPADGRDASRRLVRPLIVGLVHGLAGSAAIALLVLATIPDRLWAVVYLLVFGGGTIAGMMLITLAIALPFQYTGRRIRGFDRGLRLASGALSVALGLFLASQIASGPFATAPVAPPYQAIP